MFSPFGTNTCTSTVIYRSSTIRLNPTYRVRITQSWPQPWIYAQPTDWEGHVTMQYDSSTRPFLLTRPQDACPDFFPTRPDRFRTQGGRATTSAGRRGKLLFLDLVVLWSSPRHISFHQLILSNGFPPTLLQPQVTLYPTTILVRFGPWRWNEWTTSIFLVKPKRRRCRYSQVDPTGSRITFNLCIRNETQVQLEWNHCKFIITMCSTE